MVCSDGGGRVEAKGSLPCYFHLWPANMLLLKEELTVQVADIDRVQVNLQLHKHQAMDIDELHP